MILPVAERIYFNVCLAFGRLLHTTRYSQTQIVKQDGELRVRKRRLFYAPLLIALAEPLIRIMGAGVRFLPRKDWEEREREIYRSLHGVSIRIDDATVVLPRLGGETLATLLEHSKLNAAIRKKAIELAVVALADFHRRGFTHGDAMAENVMVDLDAGVAHWIDFETVHDSRRAMAWRRADDVRALLASCLVRAARADLDDILNLVLDVYSESEVTRLVALSFASTMRRPLIFHLGQGALSFEYFREIARLLGERHLRARQQLVSL